MTRRDRRACRLIISHPAAHAAAPIALTSAQCRSLLDHLAQLADPRHHRGRRRPLAGARPLAAIGERPGSRLIGSQQAHP
jgi:hypothetical protein